MASNKIYRTKEVADRAGVTKDTILRWLKDRRIQEPKRDRNGWRAFTEEDLRAVIEYATRETPSPDKAQANLSFVKTSS